MGLVNSDTLSSILNTFRLEVDIVNNAQYCGEWAIDTSGLHYVSFHIVVHGQCYISADCLDEPELLQTGDFVLFPHDAKHLLKPELLCPANPNQQTAVSFDDGLQTDGVGLLCGYFRFTHPVSNPLIDILPDVIIKQFSKINKDSSLNQLLNLIQTESLSGLPGSREAINRLTESLFVLIMRDHFSESNQQTGLVAALANSKIAKALDAIHTQPEHKWNLEKLAKVATLSRSAFAEQFKQYLNESPVDYLTRWRMQKAWHWLQVEGATVYSVAQRCGYDSEAAFAKAFKRVVGVGPGSARKKKMGI